MKFCSQCGNQLSAGDKFCSGCGGTVQTDQGSATAPTFSYDDGRKHSRIETHTPETGSYEEDATVEFGDLHPTAVWLFIISYMGKSIILLPLIIFGALFEPYLWALLVVYLIGHYAAARITYRNYKFELTPTSFRKEYGIIHKQSSSIPYDRVQNVNISRNLIDRMLGLSHLEIETAGSSESSSRNVLGGVSSSSEGYIPGVSADEARDIKEFIMARAQRIKHSQLDAPV